MHAFGLKLRTLRERAGYHQTALAAILPGASQAHISNLEAGRKTPTVALVLQIAHTFAVPVDYLIRDVHPIASIPALLDDLPPLDTWRSAFADALRRHRVAQQLSQRDLASRAQPLSQEFISQLEHAQKVPTPETLLKLADILNITVDRLLGATARDAANAG